jgi:hypothetical protein
MKVTFTCKRSGNRVSFSNEDDIAQLRKHEGYVEVIDPSAVPIEQPQPEQTKRRGRPRKGN